MIRPGTVIWLFLVAATGYAMFQVKYEVMQQEETLARTNKEIAETREQLRVLDAEWDYLSQPNRLQRLASRYLSLSPISAAQITSLDALPQRGDVPPALVSTRQVAAAPAIPARITPDHHSAAPRVAKIRPSIAP